MYWKQCPNCGWNNENNVHFCGDCGQDLTDPQKDSAAAKAQGAAIEPNQASAIEMDDTLGVIDDEFESNLNEYKALKFVYDGRTLVRYEGKATDLEIPVGTKVIGQRAFENNKELRQVTIPYSVTKIGDYAFSGCTGLAKVVIPNSVTEIGGWAFDGCIGLTEVYIPDSVTKIGANAFGDVWSDNCKNLRIYCAAKKKPPEWDEGWDRCLDKKQVIWKAKIEK